MSDRHKPSKLIKNQNTSTINADKLKAKMSDTIISSAPPAFSSEYLGDELGSFSICKSRYATIINTTPMNPARSNTWKSMVIATAIARRSESRVPEAHYNLRQFDYSASRTPHFVGKITCLSAEDSGCYSELRTVHAATIALTPRRKGTRILMVLLLLTLAPISIFAAARNHALSQLAGYRVVPVHYGPPNKMIMSFRINGHSANLLVDTGASQLILDAAAAESFGIKPSQRNLVEESAEGIHPGRYIRFTQINGQDLPVGIAQSLTAGSMNFASSPVALRSSKNSGAKNGRVDGILGLDILLRHKAVISCQTRLVFFKVDPARQMHLSAVASSAKFTRVPLRREENGTLTVPCSIHEQSARLLVDTGSFVTIFTEPVLKSLGVGLQPTHISARFPTSTSTKVSAAQINDLKIGDFKVRPGKFGVTPSPNFAPWQGSSRMFGILGMDTLYNCHAIIDLDGMNLFLK
jgi:predicted aspartyl protease